MCVILPYLGQAEQLAKGDLASWHQLVLAKVSSRRPGY